MKKVLLAFMAILPITFSFSQNCTPDPMFQDSTGVFPMPFEADNPSPDDGINQCAVIGQPFEFPFTVAVGDSISIPGSPNPVALEKVVVTDVLNLPEGVSYLCEPTNCTFEKNTIGCVVLKGTPTAANAPMGYELVIKVNIHVVGFPVGLPFTFPDQNLAPGVYTLHLLANASDPCDVVATKEQLADKVKMSIQPNPTTGPADIKINAGVSGGFTLSVVDLLGQPVHRELVKLQQGANSFSYDGSLLPNGLYFLVLENGLGRVAQKMTIQH